MSERIIPMRPRKLRRLLTLAAFGGMSAAVALGDFIAWIVTR